MHAEATDSFDLDIGSSPLVVSFPHSGTALPDGLAERLSDDASGLPDTDWHVPRLYDFLDDLGASRICAKYSRYVVDLNRNPTGASLYPGQATTGLVPTELFNGDPIYRDGQAPEEAEIESRRTAYFDPYHQALTELLTETRARHGYAILWDAHSIASRVPRLFEGELPVLNLGTNSGESCDRVIERWAVKAMMDHENFTSIVNGRFRGGWITRSFGRPSQNIHALQMELAQSAYMDETPPWAFDDNRAAPLRAALKDTLTAVLAAARNLYEGDLR